MATVRLSEHVNDADHVSIPGQVTRKIQNWQNYRTPGGLILPTTPGIASQNSAPPDWAGAWDFNLASLNAPLQCFFRDATDVGNRALVGVRNSQFPSAWINFKALDISQNVDVQVSQDGTTATWPDLWTNSTLKFTHAGFKLTKEIVLSAPGHPVSFGFSLKYTPTLDLILTNNQAVLKDGTSDRINIRAPYGTDANGEHITCTLTEGAPRNGLRTFWITPDMTGAVYPVIIDPTTTISGTANVEDNIIFQTAPNNNYGSNGAVQIGLVTAGQTRRELVRCASSAIPAGSIDAARYLFYRVSYGAGNLGGTLSYYAVSTANATWVEGTANGSSQNGSSCWGYRSYNTVTWSGSAGLSTVTTDYDSSTDATLVYSPYTSGPNVLTTVTFSNLANIVAFRNGTRTNGGWLLRTGEASNDLIWWNSSEAASEQPYFEIDYSEGHPARKRLGGVQHTTSLRHVW